MGKAVLKLSLVAITLFLLLPVILPSIFVFLIYDSSEAFDWNNLGSSSCDIRFSVNVSSLLSTITFPPNTTIPPRFLNRQVPQISALTARKAMGLLEAKTWPPQNLNVSAAQLFSLLELLSEKRKYHNLTCNSDLTVDEKRQCCYLSCSNWQWLTNAQEIVDRFLFIVILIFGLIAFPSISFFVVSLIRKKERIFPLVAIGWYLMFAVVCPVFMEAIARLFGRRDTVCCGKEDVFEAFSSATCIYTLVYGFIQRFMHTAAILWVTIAFFNLWIILALLKGDSFSRNSNRIHLIEFVCVWGAAFLVTLSPFLKSGPNTYSSSLLTFLLVTGDAKLDYYSHFLPSQVAYAITAVTLPHLIYTLKIRTIRRMSISGESIGQHSVRELEHVHRRFLVMVFFSFCIAMFLIINFIHRTFVVYQNNIEEAVTDYFYCVFLHADKRCPRAPPLQQLIFVRLIIGWLNVLVALIGVLIFFSADKNFRSIWRKVIFKGRPANSP
ncbi:uncharacterized protein [Oscarella lobularis]